MNRIVTIAAAVLPLACLVGSCKATTPPPATPAASPQAGPAKASATVAPAPASTAAVERLTATRRRPRPGATASSPPPAGALSYAARPPSSRRPRATRPSRSSTCSAPSADAAVAAAWAAYKPDAAWPLKVVNQMPDKDGWTDRARTTTTRPRPTSGATSARTCSAPAAHGRWRSTTWRRPWARSAARRSS